MTGLILFYYWNQVTTTFYQILFAEIFSYIVGLSKSWCLEKFLEEKLRGWRGLSLDPGDEGNGQIYSLFGSHNYK